MNYKQLIALTIALTVAAFTGSTVMARGGNGGGHGGGSGGGGFRGGFRGADFHGAGFRGRFHGDRFGHRDFDDRFFFFGEFGDPFFYYPYSYYGYYPYGYYPYGYGYEPYDDPVYQSRVGYADSVIGGVQLRLARGGYYHGAIDGVSGSETRRAIRKYEHAHALPQDGRIGQRLLTTMGVG
jgi:Putative peptidoglycan binding domain